MFIKIALGLVMVMGMIGALSASNQSSHANHGIQAPVLDSATQKGARTEVKGSFSGEKKTHYVIQFFNNETDTEITQGAQYIWEIEIKTNSRGHARFKTLLPALDYDPAFISATATRLHHEVKLDTSEFSKNVAVQ